MFEKLRVRVAIDRARCQLSGAYSNSSNVIVLPFAINVTACSSAIPVALFTLSVSIVASQSACLGLSARSGKISLYV